MNALAPISSDDVMRSSRSRRGCRHWTVEEVDRLQALWKQDQEIKEIARAMDRTPAMIANKLKDLRQKGAKIQRRMVHGSTMRKRDKAHPFARFIAREMQRQQATYDDVERRSGVSGRTVQNWMNRSSPNLASIEAVLGALGYCLIIKHKDNHGRPKRREAEEDADVAHP